jgi:dynein intermediate chain 3, axonemal
MSGDKLCFQKNSLKPEITGTSDEGEVFVVDWTIRPNEDVNRPETCIDYHNYMKNYRATVGLDRSHFFNDIILTLYDFCFCIWKEGVSVPIFQSANYKNCMITCGGFSPFRPGVIIIGRNDGWIDIWDFMDQSHKETMSHSIVACGINSLKFNQSIPNIIAVGDCDGTLHIIDLPFNFYK